MHAGEVRAGDADIPVKNYKTEWETKLLTMVVSVIVIIKTIGYRPTTIQYGKLNLFSQILLDRELFIELLPFIFDEECITNRNGYLGF